MNTRTRGAYYEQLAEQHLRSRGCRILERNARYRCGELDLIVMDGPHLVFVEVRFRRHRGWGGAIESVDLRKQKKLISAAQIWLSQHPRYSNISCRFDIVTIDSAKAQAECVWYKDAFRPT